MMHDDLNKVIVDVIGLTTTEQCRVVDQDTGEQLIYKDKTMRYSSTNSVPCTKQDVIFDPASNKGQMGALFDHFTHKIADEEDIYVKMSYEKVDPETDKSALIYEVNGEKVTTNYYNNDSLKYVEAIERLNGAENLEYLKQYDKKVERKSQPKTRRRKKPLFA